MVYDNLNNDMNWLLSFLSYATKKFCNGHQSYLLKGYY